VSFKKWVVLAVLALPCYAFAQYPSPAAAAAHSYPSHERRALTADVAEYTFDVRVGDGEFDVITIHRVVQESSPNVPARTQRAVFLAAGDIWNFRAAFLTGAHPLPVFLAENGIDVWGIDYRWTRVPATVDPSFMETWGLEQDAADLRFALGVARHARARTGSGFDKLFLLGWSRGGQIGYALLNEESQLGPGQRQVQGFIPVDIYLKTDDPQLQALACQREQNTEAAIAGGQYANPVGALVSTLGTLAVADPNGTSILNPALTNRQAGLLVGETTFALLGGLEPAPFYHFTGGVFDAFGVPAGLSYANEADLFSFEQAAAPFQPNRELADADAVTCGTTDVLFDDHLGDITVPVFYIGAGGGFGAYGIYTTTLLGSTDVTSLVVSKETPRLFDYGHADLFLANDAQELVWEPLLEWLNTR
jgi:pimeloyl-ACP methyl ester carboxylesterase